MQSLSLAQAIQSKFAKPARLDGSWLPTAEKTNADLDQALNALTEAEQIIRKQAEHIRHLESLAMTDELTGLLNRRGFSVSLQRELSLARRNGKNNGILVMADLDGFKAINDTWGHNVGDDYLRVVAHALLGSVRSSDVVARLGGDEFAILFPTMNEADGISRLAELEKDFNGRTMQFGNKHLPLRASFGLSAYTGSDTPASLLTSADLKLYAHKASRKSRG